MAKQAVDVKSRDDPISGRRGDSGVLYSFIYKDVHHYLVTQKLQSTYFNVLYAYFIIGPNVWSHYGTG